MLQIQSLTKAYAGRVLFEDVTWNVSDGDRVGLAGPNGSGKTTLLRMFVRSESPDSGKVSTPRGTTVGYLPQEGLAHSGKTLRAETLTAFKKLLAMGDRSASSNNISGGGAMPSSSQAKAVTSELGAGLSSQTL